MTSINSTELAEQWCRQEGLDREDVEGATEAEWLDDIEPAEKDRFLDAAAAEWDNNLEPERREQYIDATLARWDAGATDRRDQYLARWATVSA